jgi:hypothetical protein
MVGWYTQCVKGKARECATIFLHASACATAMRHDRDQSAKIANEVLIAADTLEHLRFQKLRNENINVSYENT